MLLGQAQLSQSVPNYKRLISFAFDEDSSHHCSCSDNLLTRTFSLNIYLGEFS